MHDFAASARKPGARKMYVSIIAALAAFMAYTCVYAYRKPFTAGTFTQEYWNVSYQTLLIISQVVGYMLSKFAGIKIISELKNKNRALAGISLVVISWLSLFLFAIVPDKWGLLCLLINGFALGFLWGIIFSYIEGRTMTDFIGAVMAVSFIFAGGFTRSVAKWVMEVWQVQDKWMPFVTGLLFIVPLVLLFIVLERLPAPDEEDIAQRVKRTPMDSAERRRLLKEMAGGLFMIVTAYLLLTVMRDIRDNYMVNIWNELGYGNDVAIFARTETLISLLLLFLMGSLVLVKGNMAALNLVHVVIFSGMVLCLVSSLLFASNMLAGGLWMQMVGVGLYMGYIPFNCIFFERLIAAFRISGTAGFLIYFADSFGYLGSTGVMLSKELFSGEMQWSAFYSSAVIISSVIALAGTGFSFIYFNRKYRWFKNAL